LKMMMKACEREMRKWFTKFWVLGIGSNEKNGMRKPMV
jgi:hypothetical protein